jgi:hypothetical protein
MRPPVLVGIAILGLGGMIALGQGGGTASPYESVLKEMVAALDMLSDTLGTIKDEPSAKAAKPELKKAVSRLEGARKKAQDLKQPDKAEKDRIAKEYKEKLDASIKKLFAEMARVKSVPGGDEAVKEIYGTEDKKPK